MPPASSKTYPLEELGTLSKQRHASDMLRNLSLCKIGLATSLTVGCVITGVAEKATNSATNWKLVWSDEFDQPDGSSPNSANWNFDIGAGGWGNRELEYYTSRTNNVRIENGHLVIEAVKEDYKGSPYTSARLKTQGKWSWTYGRIEARLKVPHGQGIWPAFWMLGDNIKDVHWPACGEIDIMENIGREPSQVHGTIHGPGYSGDAGIGGPYSLSSGTFSDDFHVFAVEWTTNQLKWSVDGNEYFKATPASLPAETKWVFTQPQFLLLNVAVGGHWPGYPDETSTFPQRMVVDYVRVYSPVDTTGSGDTASASPEAASRDLAEADSPLAPSASQP